MCKEFKCRQASEDKKEGEREERRRRKESESENESEREREKIKIVVRIRVVVASFIVIWDFHFQNIPDEMNCRRDISIIDTPAYTPAVLVCESAIRPRGNGLSCFLTPLLISG